MTREEFGRRVVIEAQRKWPEVGHYETIEQKLKRYIDAAYKVMKEGE